MPFSGVSLIEELISEIQIDGVVEIAPHTFENCESLRDIFIPDAVTEIGDNDFAGSGLSKVHVSSGLFHLGTRVFVHTRSSRCFFPLEKHVPDCVIERHQ